MRMLIWKLKDLKTFLKNAFSKRYKPHKIKIILHIKPLAKNIFSKICNHVLSNAKRLLDFSFFAFYER